MRMKHTLLLLTLLAGMIFQPAGLFGQDAREIVKTAYEKFNGEKSSFGTMSMTIVRPSWERTVTFKNWTKGQDYAMTLITGPASEKGQSFLKRKNEMWNYNPTIDRLIKLPPSMMSQGWMGSDYKNEDILKESSMVDDYTHEIIGEEVIQGRDCYKIRLTPKENAAVIWGHQIRWIDKKDYLFMKAELYDEDGYLVRTELASDIKMMGGRLIPTRLEIIPAEEEGQKTVVVFNSLEFNIPIEDSFFSMQNMKKVR